MSETVHEFTVTKNDGEEQSLSDYKGKVLLIVNTASECGFTPQYKGLQEVYEKYKDNGLEILAFPCNQFGAQEPGSNEEIKLFCEKKYATTFPIYSKVDVNGADVHPLYKYLKTQAPGVLKSVDIKWNFTKFLVDKDGKVLKRYAPITKPEDIVPDIEKALN